VGELAGLATAALWVVSSLSFTAAGRSLGATRVNLLRTVAAAAVLLVVQVWMVGGLLPAMPLESAIWLALSGVMGLTIGDQFLFTGYVMLGPRLVSVLMTLAPSMTAIVSWALFRESMGAVAVVGMLITTAGVAWVSLGRSDGVGTHSRADRRRGLFFGVAAALCQALGTVMAKRGLVAEVTPLSAQTMRMFAGAATVVPLALIAHRAGMTVAAQPNRRAFAVLALGVVSGPLLGVFFSMVATKNVPAGVAATLIGLVPVLILPATRIVDGERISTRAWIGAIIAVAGIAVLSLGTAPEEAS